MNCKIIIQSYFSKLVSRPQLTGVVHIASKLSLLHCRRSSLSTRSRMKWSRVRCWHCTRRGLATCQRARSRRRWQESSSSSRATALEDVNRARARRRVCQATVPQQWRSQTAQPCATTWGARRPHPGRRGRS